MATTNVAAPQVLVSHDEVKKHKSTDDCWVILHSKVYDVTSFVKEHPGGAGGMCSNGMLGESLLMPEKSSCDMQAGT